MKMASGPNKISKCGTIGLARFHILLYYFLFIVVMLLLLIEVIDCVYCRWTQRGLEVTLELPKAAPAAPEGGTLHLLWAESSV